MKNHVVFLIRSRATRLLVHGQLKANLCQLVWYFSRAVAKLPLHHFERYLLLLFIERSTPDRQKQSEALVSEVVRQISMCALCMQHSLSSWIACSPRDLRLCLHGNECAKLISNIYEMNVILA